MRSNSKERGSLEKRKQAFKDRFSEWAKDNHNKIFLGIIIFAVLVRIYFFFKTLGQPVWWDAADYLTQAKVFGKGIDIGYVFNPRRPFFLALLWGLLFKIGLDEAALRVTELLFSIAAIFGMYIVSGKIFNKKIALISTFLLAIFWQHLFFTYRLMTEIPSLAFFLFSVYFFWEGYVNKKHKMLLWFGFFLGMAVLARAGTLMMVFSFLLFIVAVDKWRFVKNKYLWAAGFIFLLVMSSFLGYVYIKENSNPVDRFLGVSEGRFSKPNSMGLRGILVYSAFMPEYLGWALLIPFILGIGIFFFELAISADIILKKPDLHLKQNLFLLFWFAVPFLYHALLPSHMEPRYLMMAFPPFFIILSRGLLSIEKMIRPYHKHLGIFIVVLFLAFGAYYQLNQANKIIMAKSVSYLEVKQAGLWLKENSMEGDIIFSASVPQHQYYAERRIYNYMTKKTNESEFEQKVMELRPAFLVLSVFEPHAEWAYSYPQTHQEMLTPVQVYARNNNQPSLIIYKFNYGNEIQNKS